jgi:LAO/AO transport system kinase
MPQRADAVELANRVKAGEIRAVSRLISFLENQDPTGLAALRALGSDLRRAPVVGITGYPGVGKSTVVTQLAKVYRRRGLTVGILAIDSSSPVTGGALLGDRLRMQEHAVDPGVFIRSMANRGQRGGLAPATCEAVVVLERAGYDVILVETVGVGQTDVDVADVAGTVVMVVAPGLGDEIQAMKAGLLEVAHIVVVNKADLDGAEATVQDLRQWCPTVLKTVATKGEGIEELVQAIADQQRGCE